MKNRLFILLLAFANCAVIAQESDSLPAAIRLDEVIVVATRTSRALTDLPVQAALIDAKMIQGFPISNIDDILKTTANVYVNRSWGIFSKNAAVTMRGLEGSDRILVMVDGVPKNRIAGGSVNWHNVNPGQVERIEVSKGPASALYGNNAMGGVINIITNKPEKESSSASIKLFYGSYQTIGSSVTYSGNSIKKDKGWYWNVNGFYRHGDGYVFEAPEYLDDTDVKTSLDEGGGGFRLGYQSNKNNTLEIVYDGYNEIRGAGRSVNVPKGSYDDYLTNNVRLTSNNLVAGGILQSTIYYSAETYYGQKESLNDFMEYRLLDSYADRIDMGLFSNWSKLLFPKNYFTFGLELKSGSLDANEVYRTSPDEIITQSKMDIYSVYLQDEIRLIDNKLQFILGLRGDAARFYDASQEVISPTKVTGFLESFYEVFEPTNWLALSPKIAVQYRFSPQFQMYSSVGVGFKPPKLKDLSQSGKISKGFRLANPNLKPEYLTNYEIGYSIQASGLPLSFDGAVYYSLGRDFQYSVSTGDSVDTGGNSLKPIIMADNIANVRIIGTEFTAAYNPHKSVQVHVTYSYNHSIITEYQSSLVNPELDLAGKKMVEVPPHLFFAGLNWTNPWINVNANCNYVDDQWYDVENTIKVDSWFLANIKLSHTFQKKFEVYLDIQNILNTVYIDRKGQLSPGRYILLGFQYKINPQSKAN